MNDKQQAAMALHKANPGSASLQTTIPVFVAFGTQPRTMACLLPKYGILATICRFGSVNVDFCHFLYYCTHCGLHFVCFLFCLHFPCRGHIRDSDGRKRKRKPVYVRDGAMKTWTNIAKQYRFGVVGRNAALIWLTTH